LLAKMAVAIPISLLGLEALVNISRTTTAIAAVFRTKRCTATFESTNVEALSRFDEYFSKYPNSRPTLFVLDPLGDEMARNVALASDVRKSEKGIRLFIAVFVVGLQSEVSNSNTLSRYSPKLLDMQSK
jgi:hypothetical protein